MTRILRTVGELTDHVIGAELLNGFDIDTYAYLDEALNRVGAPKLVAAINDYVSARFDCPLIAAADRLQRISKTARTWFDITLYPGLLTLRMYLPHYFSEARPEWDELPWYLCGGLNTSSPINAELERELHEQYRRIVQVDLKLRQVCEDLNIVDTVVGEGPQRCTLMAIDRLACVIDPAYAAKFDLKLPTPRGLRTEFDLVREIGPRDLQTIRKLLQESILLRSAGRAGGSATGASVDVFSTRSITQGAGIILEQLGKVLP